jgi:hypothetical protein
VLPKLALFSLPTAMKSRSLRSATNTDENATMAVSKRAGACVACERGRKVDVQGERGEDGDGRAPAQGGHCGAMCARQSLFHSLSLNSSSRRPSSVAHGTGAGCARSRPRSASASASATLEGVRRCGRRRQALRACVDGHGELHR